MSVAPEDPLFVQREAAMKAKAQAIQSGIPGIRASCSPKQHCICGLKAEIKAVKDDLKRDYAGIKEDLSKCDE